MGVLRTTRDAVHNALSVDAFRKILRRQGAKPTSQKGVAVRNKQDAIQAATSVIQSANSDLGQARGELVFLLGSILFVSITVLSISDRDLLFGSRVQLPLLGLGMGFDAFLLGSPLMLVIVHFALLLKLGAVRAKCEAIRDMSESLRQVDIKTAETLSLSVGSHFMAQWIVGGTALFQRRLGFLVYLLCLWAAPLFALLLIIVRTLPLHRAPITAFQIGVLSLDVGLLVLFHWKLGGRLRAALGVGLTAWAVCSVTLSIPDSLFDELGQRLWSAKAPFGRADTQRKAFAPTSFLFENSLDGASGRPLLFFSRNLIVTDDRPDREEISNEDAVKSGERKSIHEKKNLRGRDLRYAILDRTVLQEVDFTLSDLTGASLREADLKRATFGCVAANDDPIQQLWFSLKQPFQRIDPSDTIFPKWIEAASSCTNLKEVNFTGADLRGAKFVWGQSRKPSLAGAQLFGALLDEVSLTDMDFSFTNLGKASLAGADLSGSKFVGATLTAADLTGAVISSADFHLAALTLTKLDGAYLVGSRFVGADLTGTTFLGANLSDSSFVAAHFDSTLVWGTTPPKPSLFAWAFVDRIQSVPKQYDIESAKMSLEKLPANPRYSDGVRNLKKLVEGTNDALIQEKNEAWRSVLDALQRDGNDRRLSIIDQIVTEAACARGDVAMAVEFWSRPTEYSGGEPIPNVPSKSLPEPDVVVAELSAPSFPDSKFGSSYEFYPDTVNPLRTQYDLTALIDKLKQRECELKGSAADSLITALTRNSEQQRRLIRKN